MKETLRDCEIFRGLDEATLARVTSLARTRSYAVGERPFVLGQSAESLYVVLSGRIDLCLPIPVLGNVRDVTVDTKGPGSALGWSAFVKPHRFRHSARVAEACELAVVPRETLGRMLAEDPAFGARFFERTAELIATRLLTVQALWARELQRHFDEGSAARARTA